MSSYLNSLAERHPEYFKPEEAKRLVEWKNFESDITARAQAAQDADDAKKIHPVRRKLLPPAAHL